MDVLKNPFAPGAGTRPPELVGRDQVLVDARILLERVYRGMPQQSQILTGLRGVGKTVLLNVIRGYADSTGYHTLQVEASPEKSLQELLAPGLRAALLELDSMQGVSQKVKRGLQALMNYVGGIEFKLGELTVGIDPLRGLADSGDIEVDTSDLLVAVGEAAKDRGSGLCLLIDEIQYLKPSELGALIVAMHRIQQEGLPVALVGAGLPTLPGLAGNAKSYAERLFTYPHIGELTREQAHRAIQNPIERQNESITAPALDLIYEQTRGYPYFLQEWGYQVWLAAEISPILPAAVDLALFNAIRRLDGSFFRVRYDRLSPSERRLLSAMAASGPGPYRIGDVAIKLGVKTTSLGPIRAKLISKGMIFSPQHGELDFTVPLFDAFIRRSEAPK